MPFFSKNLIVMNRFRNFYFLFSTFLLFLQACNHKKTLFSQLESNKSGINFNNIINESPEKNVMVYEYYYNGGGVAAADFNNDGLCDLYFTGNAVENTLYLNKGNLTFEDVTVQSGVKGRDGWKTGVTVADVNGDGLLDIYVSYSGPVLKENLYDELFINTGLDNNGVPKFIEKAKDYGLDSPFTFTTQATFFDYDNDGDLDMFQINHGSKFYFPYFNTEKLRSQRHPQFSNRLYRNDNNKFTEVSEAAMVQGGGLNFGLSACASDINSDGWMDLYVTNDFEEQDYLYLNNKNGTFKDVSKFSTGHTSKFSMGSDIADFNNDLLQDILVVDMLPETLERQKLLKGPDEYEKYNLMITSGFHHQNMRNTLQLNQGNNNDGIPLFSEIGQLAGIYNTDWSWSALMADLDNNGDKDIFITNGFLRDFTNLDFLKYTYQDASEMAYKKNTIMPVFELIKKMPTTKLSNFVYSNNGDLTFENKTKEWGLDFPLMSSGAVYVDLDNDGDLELVTNNTNDKASIWENHSNELIKNNFIKIKLKGTRKNTFGIGSKIFVSQKERKQMQELIPSRGFQSSMDYVLNFGLGKTGGPIDVSIIWPDGTVSEIKNAKINSLLEINQAGSIKKDILPAGSNAKTFIDYTAQSGFLYTHEENRYIDFKSELLLLYQLSMNGPCLAKGDVNNDGLEDVFVGGSAGYVSKIFLQTNKVTFQELKQSSFEADKECEDTGALFFDADNDNDLDLYVVSGGNEFPTGSLMLADRLYINDGKGNFRKDTNAIPKEFSSGSCVKAADYDRDGDLDLYVGGKINGGKFPSPGYGGILRNETDKKIGKIKFVLATKEVNPVLKDIGMITDANWSDLNGDQWPDLIITGDWMQLKIFINKNGKLNELQNSGLENSSGLWSSILAKDFDNDGDIDFIAGNVGTNLQWKPTIQQPMTLYSLDLDENGKVDPIVCIRLDGKDYPLATRDELLEQIPILKKKFVFYKDYSKADINKIFTEEQLKKAKIFKLENLHTSYIENLGNGKFKIKSLPNEAQFSKVNAILSDDYDNDGKLDVLIAGNFFPYQVQYGKADASYGLLLKGDGKGNFYPVRNDKIGLYANGDVRGMVSLKSKNEELIIIAKNKDNIQVLKKKYK